MMLLSDAQEGNGGLAGYERSSDSYMYPVGSNDTGGYNDGSGYGSSVAAVTAPRTSLEAAQTIQAPIQVQALQAQLQSQLQAPVQAPVQVQAATPTYYQVRSSQSVTPYANGYGQAQYKHAPSAGAAGQGQVGQGLGQGLGQYMYAGQYDDDGYLTTLWSKRRDVLKLILMALVVILALSCHKVAWHYLCEYLEGASLSRGQEIALTVAYPVVVLAVMWHLKAFQLSR
jgi:hypothetical protein